MLREILSLTICVIPFAQSMLMKSASTSSNESGPFALHLRERIQLVSCVFFAKRTVKKDRFVAVFSAETKPSLLALLAFSHQSHLLATVIQPLLLANST